MTCHLRVISPGARSLVQDLGFRQARAQGVPAAGVLDRDSLFLVNALLGNPAGTEALELAMTSPILQAEYGSVRIATSGGLRGSILSPDGAERVVPAWTATTLNPGERLRLDAPERGASALLGIGGGLDLAEIMGSRATLTRAALGGVGGRGLAEGDRLYPRRPCVTDVPDLTFHMAPPADAGPLRVVPGPQDDRFTAAAWQTFTTAQFEITPQSDRMGMRLQGPVLEHDPTQGPDIISDGAAPGAIQVPGNGQPIILLADAQTTGGYTKIATVIGADLPRLAARIPGDTLRFTVVSVAQAEAAARSRHALLKQIAGSIGAANPGGIDQTALHSVNLISGVVDMRSADHFPGHLADRD
ncbi:KipI antagonist [Thalassovita gelatinovora]|uniref:KipI antagonist n=1 Tax=Thalassovita gelatinovora TaxID=53501 RepID=A0A0N7LVV6_THAGE|nr:biotin-dependent carboxyltransferase family protein [Thalassovita gelatinovora]QIZ81959.1 biotin-dependent carboxyltransferase family protein [Thalassovita gelatinovora]CUH67362.1 KipI antagonist [Thalassovita gelatinovora]SEP75542.1 Allophanate hydrolase subunit 2 [Thalassovita gelatinovora]